MTISKTSVIYAPVALLLGLGLSVSAAYAASQCKGIEENACAGMGDCVWVDGYTRKDGRPVSGYCRLRSGKKADSQAGSDAPKLSRSD